MPGDKVTIGQVVYVAEPNNVSAYRVDRISSTEDVSGKQWKVYADAKGNSRELSLLEFFATEAEARDAIKKRAKAAYDDMVIKAEKSALDINYI